MQVLNKMADLRVLYKPVQPTVKQSADNITYAEILPDSNLQKFIYCYWQFKTSSPLTSPFNHLIVADGCIDIYFDLNNPQENYVMGFCKKYTEFLLENSFNYVGIRFLPTMFPQLFSISAKELSNRFEHLENVTPATSDFIENHFYPELGLDEIKKKLDNYFLQIVSDLSFNWDSRLYQSIDIILKNKGVLEIEQLDTGISQRQLRRLYEFYIGDTAKTFSNIVRFQNMLHAKPSSESLRKNKLFYDAGYYDQAHFIKAFKNFYGVTPGKAFEI